MGVVTAAVSLIDALVKKNPDEYKGCVALAVSRLSRVPLVNFFLANFKKLQDQRHIPDRHHELQRLPRLHVLLCAGAMAQRQATQAAPELPTP